MKKTSYSNDRFGSAAVILPQTGQAADSGQKQALRSGKLGAGLGFVFKDSSTSLRVFDWVISVD